MLQIEVGMSSESCPAVVYQLCCLCLQHPFSSCVGSRTPPWEGVPSATHVTEAFLNEPGFCYAVAVFQKCCLTGEVTVSSNRVWGREEGKKIASSIQHVLPPVNFGWQHKMELTSVAYLNWMLHMKTMKHSVSVFISDSTCSSISYWLLQGKWREEVLNHLSRFSSFAAWSMFSLKRSTHLKAGAAMATAAVFLSSFGGYWAARWELIGLHFPIITPLWCM